MLNVCLGHFHPDLEDALCNNISSLKAGDPLAPVAIIIPSGRIRSRIKSLFAKERGMSLLNLHLLTFHDLTLRLYEEKYGRLQRLIGDDFFFIEFIRQILNEGLSGMEMFRHFKETPDGCAALRATLEDLREARVDADNLPNNLPNNLIEALREGVFSAEDTEKIIPLIGLYQAFLLRKRRLEIIDYSDLTDIASELAPASEYLRRFREIIYYGFYDLIQVQYDLFRAVAQHYPTTLYFPLVDGMPAFSFARRFYEGYIQGMVPQSGGITRVSTPVITGAGRDTLFPFGHLAKIITASGAEDEVLTAAKGILQLVDSEGYAFSDIGVVARGIDDYGPLIRRIFDVHKIPFVSSAREPISRYQVTKIVHLLISLDREDYRRSDIMDILSSQFCKTRSFCPEGVEPRPDLWDFVTRSIGISKGLAEWSKLDRYVRDGFVFQGRGEDEGGRQVVSGAQIEGLQRFVLSIQDDFDALPEKSSWRHYAELFQAFIRKYIHEEPFIREALFSLKEFDLIRREVLLSDFIDTFSRRLEDESIPIIGPIGEREIAGVQVLDVMAARCIPFKVLFVIGMNEKVFPRNIKEDPLLRDSARGVLERGLGYKITEKLYGYEEERLLFYLLLHSARERIYLLYQRTDEAGQVKIPSSYLAEMRRGYPVPEERVPRRMADKFSSSEFFSRHLLTPKELSIRSIFEGRDPGPILASFSMNPALYRHGVQALMTHEEMGSGLTPFDGATGGIAAHWLYITQRGISPTSLEDYARCPFAYFARHVLGLQRLMQPELIFEIPPVDIGSICHKVLRRFYARGVGSISSSAEMESLLGEDMTAVFREYWETNPAGYPLIREILQERLSGLLKMIIQDDLDEMARSGFTPHSFEADASGCLMEDLPEDMRDISLHGVLDRIDVKKDTGQFRIIDYKFKSGKKISSDDKDLSLSAIRGKRLQPPLYLLIATPYLKYTAGIKDPQPEKVRFYFIAPWWSADEDSETRSEFPGDCWQTPLGERITATVALLLKGIREGLFFILPGDYCSHCDYSAVCRKNHFPSRWRAERDVRVKPYYAIRKQKI